MYIIKEYYDETFDGFELIGEVINDFFAQLVTSMIA